MPSESVCSGVRVWANFRLEGEAWRNTSRLTGIASGSGRESIQARIGGVSRRGQSISSTTINAGRASTGKHGERLPTAVKPREQTRSGESNE